MKTLAESVTAFAESGILNEAATSTEDAEASFSKKILHELKSSLSAVSIKSFAFTDGGTLSSVRVFLIAFIDEIIFSKSVSEADLIIKALIKIRFCLKIITKIAQQ